MTLNSININQVHDLEEIFAEFKGDLGWVIPEWLLRLKMAVIIRDLEQSDQANQAAQKTA